jgi:methionine synthase II (cobalamin-independent)
MPGEDFAESLQVVLGEVGDLPFLPELPDRGVQAAMTGRTLAVVTDLGIDLQPAGWRLTDTAGIDHRRAASLLAHDLDILEELRPARLDTFKIQVAGPWTLAASVERPRGDKVLADHGARRDLAQALAEGVSRHVDDVRRRLAPERIVLQLDEPALPAVLAGAIPTASGFSRHRSVDAPEAATALGWVVERVRGESVDPKVRDDGVDGDDRQTSEIVLHCCAEDLPWQVLTEVDLDAVSFDLGLLDKTDLDAMGDWLDRGRHAWPGVVPTAEPERWPTGADLTRKVLTWWADLGYRETERLPPTTVTPACGLAGASPRWARTALELAAHVARNLSVEQGKMVP